MADLDLSQVDIENVLKRLTLHAHRLFFGLAGLAGDSSLRGLGVGPEDLAMETLAKFLDPQDHSVRWSEKHGVPTTEGVLRYLRTVLHTDFIDLLRSKAHETTVVLEAHAESREDDEEGAHRTLTLDEFATMAEGPDGKAIRAQQRARLLARFDDEPELKELLEVQLDPDGYCAYTNQDLAVLLAPPNEPMTQEALKRWVSEVENRKKRVDRRLRKILAEMRAAREGNHG
jgi:DNA-directed RNA polymerase specialized sigma24 family protein